MQAAIRIFDSSGNHLAGSVQGNGTRRIGEHAHAGRGLPALRGALKKPVVTADAGRTRAA
jgi:hypothetical protein